MCGIVGYVGRSEAAPILLDGLRRLEYRGYDSAGVAIVDGDHVNSIHMINLAINEAANSSKTVNANFDV